MIDWEEDTNTNPSPRLTYTPGDPLNTALASVAFRSGSGDFSDPRLFMSEVGFPWENGASSFSVSLFATTRWRRVSGANIESERAYELPVVPGEEYRIRVLNWEPIFTYGPGQRVFRTYVRDDSNELFSWDQIDMSGTVGNGTATVFEAVLTPTQTPIYVGIEPGNPNANHPTISGLHVLNAAGESVYRINSGSPAVSDNGLPNLPYQTALGRATSFPTPGFTNLSLGGY